MSNLDHPNSTPSSFRTKLGSYATGLAIGFLLLGFFMYQKNRSQQQDSARIEQLQEQGRKALDRSTDGSTP